MVKVQKTDEEWRQQLTSEQYHVCRQKGTEPAFSGKYNTHKENGLYRCVACNAPLFHSKHKFESGTGWPSFWTPYDAENVESEEDLTHGMRRTEVLCNACGSHLGHVFEDGPAPTNLRYCINSTALAFDSTDDS